MADFSSGVRLSAANIWLRVWPVAAARSLNAGNDQAACSVRSSALARYSDHRLAHDLAHLVLVVADEGVQHQRHVAVARMSASRHALR